MKEKDMMMSFDKVMPLINHGYAAYRKAWRTAKGNDVRQVVLKDRHYVAQDAYGRTALTQPDWAYEITQKDWMIEDKRDRKDW